MTDNITVNVEEGHSIAHVDYSDFFVEGQMIPGGSCDKGANFAFSQKIQARTQVGHCPLGFYLSHLQELEFRCLQCPAGEERI
jgi:hypothetical protein